MDQTLFNTHTRFFNMLGLIIISWFMAGIIAFTLDWLFYHMLKRWSLENKSYWVPKAGLNHHVGIFFSLMLGGYNSLILVVSDYRGAKKKTGNI